MLVWIQMKSSRDSFRSGETVCMEQADAERLIRSGDAKIVDEEFGNAIEDAIGKQVEAMVEEIVQKALAGLDVELKSAARGGGLRTKSDKRPRIGTGPEGERPSPYTVWPKSSVGHSPSLRMERKNQIEFNRRHGYDDPSWND